MDGNQMVGLVGGIMGGIVGVMGGIVGTYFSIKNTYGPRERAFMIRCAVWAWIGVSVFLLCQMLPSLLWHSSLAMVVTSLLWLVYMPLLFWLVRWGNQRQALARAEDAANAGRSSGGSLA